ncbi:Metallo-dependent phosphatase-like protein [Bisporella sp. PMI_857]|nr:Metallo-dependent phosphatase-like protein [Bisporella sp. PMI_857]
MGPQLRRTRIVCVSDTHNSGKAIKLPKGDVLIHAGDLSNQGSFSELQKAIHWLEEADFEAKIVIAGNHDITLDSSFYEEYGSYFHSQNPQDHIKCQELLENSTSIIWLRHEAAIIRLLSPNGPRTTFKIFGSPLSPANGMWAFGYSTDDAARIWESIPLATDIVVTHTPPKYHCDSGNDRRTLGCEALRQALWRIRPRIAVCGHVHEGRGAERIEWDLDSTNCRYKERSVQPWMDPGKDNRKLSLLDLTGKLGRPLQNDGAIGDCEDINCAKASTPVSPILVQNKDSIHTQFPMMEPSLTAGCGGIPLTSRSDILALSGRTSRLETCVVNAAIMSSSWPHRGGKSLNKPIVVDIELPTWGD